MLKKKLDELTLKDNFMFCAVMADVDNCRGFLEMCLGISVGRVEVSSEKSVVFRPEYRSVQLDVYAKDADNTHYDIEMQVVQKPGLARRSRYYHSQMDMELLHCGQDYHCECTISKAFQSIGLQNEIRFEGQGNSTSTISSK